LLLFSLLLYRAGRENHSLNQSSSFNWQLHLSQWQPILIVALVPAGLFVIWAATLPSFMTAWTIFVALWALYLLTTGDHPQSVTRRMFWLILPLLFAGFAAALKPVDSDLLDMGGWSQAAVIAILLTTMSQMGIMPFIGWRPRANTWQPVDGPILFLLPPLLGAGLLIRLVATGYIEPAVILILTIFALISILSGVHRAWANLRSTARLPGDLASSLSGLAFLVAIWTVEVTLLAGIQLLVFAATILFLLENHAITRQRWWRAVGPLLSLLALAAFPFTTGFITLSSIYTTWLSSGFWILVLALVLLMLPLLTAVLIFIRDHTNAETTAGQPRLPVATEIAQLLPATGLFMLGGLTWTEIHWGTWLALLLTAAGALLLARYIGEAQDAINTVDAALSLEKLLPAQSGPIIQKFVRQVIFSLGEAAFILEGDRGLLWLTAFLAILLFAISG
jgi:hypothetical protein